MFASARSTPGRSAPSKPYLPAIATMPVSIRSACGSSWRRTRELAPSAPINTSAVADVPSEKCAVTRASAPIS